MEEEVHRMTQQIGIGAQFGGKYFCHDVRVVRLPDAGRRLMPRSASASSCSADRQVDPRQDHQADGVFLEQLETNPRPVPAGGHRPDACRARLVNIDLTRPMAEIRAELSQYPIKTRLSLSGPLIVARDIAHAKLKERLDRGEAADFKDLARRRRPGEDTEGYASGSFGRAGQSTFIMPRARPDWLAAFGQLSLYRRRRFARAAYRTEALYRRALRRRATRYRASDTRLPVAPWMYQSEGMRRPATVEVSAADRARTLTVVADRNRLQSTSGGRRSSWPIADGLGTVGTCAASASRSSAYGAELERFVTDGVDGLLRDESTTSRIPLSSDDQRSRRTRCRDRTHAPGRLL